MAEAATQPSPSALSDSGPFPMRIGRAEEFARVRQFFQSASFDHPTVCGGLGIAQISDVDKVDWDVVRLAALPAPLHWAIALFLRCLPVREEDSRAVCGDETFAAFLALGMCRPAKRDPAVIVSTVWVYPADGFVLVSDRRDDPDGKPFTPPADVVFPASYHGTLRFLQLLPDARGGAALDLGGGSGIGALHVSRNARVAATSDITERSAFFAAFNARLNGAPVESLCGDMYAPVLGRQFDLISCHPPWVPTAGTAMVFRDGGDTGEEITRRTIEGLPAHLRPGGTAVILCMARDTSDKTFEQNARDWLGPAAPEFDIVLGLEKVLTIDEVVKSLRSRLDQQGGEQAARELHARLEGLGTRQFVYGALFLRRYDQPVDAPPLRIRATPQAIGADFDHLLAWRQFYRQPGFQESVAKSKPRLARQLELTARHVVRDGKLTLADHVFSIESAFHTALRPDPFVVAAVKRFDGKRSVGDIFHGAKRAGEFPQGFPLEAFADLVRLMVEQGFLELDFPH